jgi:GT2 family glycosyltransferase
MKVAITAPVFIKNSEHQRFLDLTTRSFISRDHDIVWIPVENYIAPDFRPLDYAFLHPPESVQLISGGDVQSVAKGWNLGIEEAHRLACDYVLVINTDIILKSNAIDRLVTFAESHPDAVMWTMSEYADLALLEQCPEDENYTEHPHFSCYMVKPDFFKHVGRFDENFTPAYCEDGDMHARLALAGLKAYVYGGARFFHFGSRTIKSDNELWQKNGQTFPKNQQYFLEKWGHPTVNNVEDMRTIYFKTPFNNPDYLLSYWPNGDKETN